MSAAKKPIVLILGGAGAQNDVVTRLLSGAGTYTVHLQTRSANSPHAAELGGLPNVKLVEGDCYDEDTLKSALEGVDMCYVNTNGFAIGEKNEIYWSIRIFKIAQWAGVKHFIYSSLPYVSGNGNFDPKRRVPFVDGKAKVSRKFHLPECVND
jgi:uncharacterized protein YbjT (DUF2867 family)